MCADRASPLHAAISEDVLSLSSKARLAGFETVRVGGGLCRDAGDGDGDDGNDFGVSITMGGDGFT